VAGRQTFRILIVGKTGSGKSTLAKAIVRRMEGRYQKLVVVNRKREFAEFVEKGFTVGEAGDPEPALRRYDRVHFHVTGYDPRPFLDALGQAILRRRDVLLVVDEAHPFFERGRVPKGLFEVLTGGREAGHNAIFVTQMLKGAVGGIDPGIRRQASHLVTFHLTEPEEVRALSEQFPSSASGSESSPAPRTACRPSTGSRTSTASARGRSSGTPPTPGAGGGWSSGARWGATSRSGR